MEKGKRGATLLLALLLTLLFQSTFAESVLTPLDYDELPAAHRAQFEAEIESAIANAKSRVPSEEQLLLKARGVSAGYEDSVSKNGISFKYTVQQSVVKVGETIRFTVSDVTSGSAPFVCSVTGLLCDENFQGWGTFEQYHDRCDQVSWDGTSYVYVPKKTGYVNFVVAISNEDGKNFVAVTSNTIQIYSDEKPLFQNMAIQGDLAALLSLDGAQTRVGDVITASALLSTKNGPVNYTATWTLYDAEENVLDRKTSTAQIEMKGQAQTIHFDYWPLQQGETQFEFSATDGDGNAIRINTPGVTVQDGFAFRATLDKTVVNLGESLTGSYQINGHICNDVKYIVGWSCYDAQDPDKELYTVSNVVDTPSGQVSFTPRFGERIEFFARASCNHFPDIYPAYSSATLLYGVNVQMSLTATTVKSGNSLGLNYSVSDGLEPYQRIQITGYSYNQETYRTYQFFQQTVSATEGKVTGKPYLGDLVYYEIKVTEKDGFVSTWRSYMIPLTDAPEASTPALAAALDAETLELGETVTLTYQMTGGSGSVSKEDPTGCYAAWKKVDGTIVASKTLTATFDTVTFTPEEAGEYICIVMLTDAYGQRVSWTSDSIYVGNVRIPGDVTGSGSVDLADAQMVINYCVDSSVSINTANADVNGDGKVDMDDALLLLQFAAGWDVKLK